jgi:type VI protein secretion system component VasK
MIGRAKLVAATLVVVGAFLSFLDLRYAPHHLLLQSSPQRPPWLSWAAWAMPTASALLYIILDVVERRRKQREPSNTEQVLDQSED